MRTACLALLLVLSALPCSAGDGDPGKPRASIHLGQVLPGGSLQPGLSGSVDLGKYTSFSVGVGQSTVATGSQRFEPSGTVGLTVRF